MDNSIIMDSYEATGSDYAEFKKRAKDMADITKDTIVKGNDIMFLSLCEIPEVQMDGKIIFYILTPDYIKAFMEEGKKLVIGRVSRSDVPDPLYEEMRATTGLMAIIGDTKYLIGDTAMPTLSIRASVSGNLTINRQNLIRNLHLADAIFAKNEKIHLVYREIEYTNDDGSAVTVRKILAGLGNAFQPVSQTIISDTADLLQAGGLMKTATTSFWSIDQRFTDLYQEFPEVAQDLQDTYSLPDPIVPGVFLCTSDVGASSVIVRGTYRVNGKGGYVITDEVAMKHTKDISAEKILEKADESIFSNFRKLPEALSELIGTTVLDYSKNDLSTKRGAEANYQAVLDVMKRTLEKTLKTVLPKKRQATLLECLADEIDSSRPYTLYDIATTFMELPDRIAGELDEVTITEIRKALAKTPYILQDKKLVKALPEKEAEIYLMPS